MIRLNPMCKTSRFRIWDFENWDLFRISDFGFRIFTVLAFVLFFSSYSFAQDRARVDELTAKILQTEDKDDLYTLFEDLTDLYFQENKYNEFVEFLKPLMAQNAPLEPVINYYIALARYYQLKYLEGAQAWDEYFNQGNNYRDQITRALEKTLQARPQADLLYIYARLLLWKFHKDQETALADAELSALMDATIAYSKDAANLIPIEDAAAQLSSYGEKGKAQQLYKIYVERIVSLEIKNEELENIALDFYREGNLELSQTIYDVYIDRLSASVSKEQLIPALINIAKAFSFRTDAEYDGYYAEKLFAKIEEIGGRDIFDADLIYLRALTLEKIKEYDKARDIYIDLVQRYPENINADETNFKIAFFYAYVAQDIENARVYFEKLAHKETVNSYALSSLYQLGLLSQWQENLDEAKEYYSSLIAQANKVDGEDKFSDTVALAEERLKEIEEPKPMEFALKTFLDISLKPENSVFEMKKVDLKASGYKVNRAQELNVHAIPYIGESGCMQVELQYLWSGHLGGANPSSEKSSVTLSYDNRGTKEINLAVLSATGIIDRNFELVDVN